MKLSERGQVIELYREVTDMQRELTKVTQQVNILYARTDMVYRTTEMTQLFSIVDRALDTLWTFADGLYVFTVADVEFSMPVVFHREAQSEAIQGTNAANTLINLLRNCLQKRSK